MKITYLIIVIYYLLLTKFEKHKLKLYIYINKLVMTKK